jgi:hypothetical protein
VKYPIACFRARIGVTDILLEDYFNFLRAKKAETARPFGHKSEAALRGVTPQQQEK